MSVFPLEALSAAYKKHGVNKWRAVDRKRLEGIFDVERMEKLLVELKEEDEKERERAHEAKNARYKELFLSNCPPGVKITSFVYDVSGALEDDEFAQYFHGPRWDLENEFDVQYNADVFLSIEDDGDEDVEIFVELDIYQDTDAGDGKVTFETWVRQSQVVFPLRYKDAVLALFADAPKAARGEIQSHISSQMN